MTLEQNITAILESYFSGFKDELIEACAQRIMRQIERQSDTPQTDCETCKHYKLACELFSEVCKYEPTTQTETENSNLTFEKVMEEIQTQVIEFPDTHQKFTFARKIEMDGDSIKIGGWEYKGVKDAERLVKGSEQTDEFKNTDCPWK